VLTDAYPEAIAIQDDHGRTPLHFALCLREPGEKLSRRAMRHLLDLDWKHDKKGAKLWKVFRNAWITYRSPSDDP